MTLLNISPISGIMQQSSKVKGDGTVADFTKKAICESFLKLLNQKPLKQITIKDIVEDCGVNRNTFYYHFQGIPELIENILLDDAKQFLEKNKELESLEDCLNEIVSFIMDHRVAVLHACKSINRDFFEQYQWRICEHLVNEFLNRRLENVKVSKEDRKLIEDYIESLVYGVIMRWLAKDLREDIHPFIHRLCYLKQGDLDEMIEKCRIS